MVSQDAGTTYALFHQRLVSQIIATTRVSDMADCGPTRQSGHEAGPGLEAVPGLLTGRLANSCVGSACCNANCAGVELGAGQTCPRGHEQGLPLHRSRRNGQWFQHRLYSAVRGPAVLLPVGTRPGFRGLEGTPQVLFPRPDGARRDPHPLPTPQKRKASRGSERSVDVLCPSPGSDLEGTGGPGSCDGSESPQGRQTAVEA